MVSLDFLFHRTIIIGTNNNFINRSWEALEIGIMRCIYKRYKIYDSIEKAFGNYSLINEHIKNNDEENAEDLISVYKKEEWNKFY